MQGITCTPLCFSVEHIPCKLPQLVSVVGSVTTVDSPSLVTVVGLHTCCQIEVSLKSNTFSHMPSQVVNLHQKADCIYRLRLTSVYVSDKIKTGSLQILFADQQHGMLMFYRPYCPKDFKKLARSCVIYNLLSLSLTIL